VLQASPATSFIPRSSPTPWRGFGFIASGSTLRSSSFVEQPTNLVDYGT
jgi:hypothetical protein